jgi:hypothetical protein
VGSESRQVWRRGSTAYALALAVPYFAVNFDSSGQGCPAGVCLGRLPATGRGTADRRVPRPRASLRVLGLPNFRPGLEGRWSTYTAYAGHNLLEFPTGFGNKHLPWLDTFNCHDL